MQYANPAQTWAEWDTANPDAEDDVRLGALREYIFQLAERFTGSGDIQIPWANKKLAKLGITDRIEREHTYTVKVPVSGFSELKIYGRNRAEALTKLDTRLNGNGSTYITEATKTGGGEIIYGPEDVTADVADDAPQTVDATLAKLRETIMLAHIAGPRICSGGANGALDNFGLARLPQTKTFTVKRPVTAVLETTVEAYDEETAQRVGAWRWEDDRSGYVLGEVDASGDTALVTA